ncbi:MAG: bifunctional phosphopantothenoylcysteine decarboxylase/phosphopantothenate--cysteine ligase CoaBC [Eggerthellaceae bacterium]|nr:bifunctional phosphopantothenoylcysteine decarboxylase/phosphopantothenate--cysteine ligase CoaBC [Eggerthellaceae bacterium]
MKKTVLLGVTGCVAAYKACEVVRGLQKAGLRVKVVMTKNATEFINPGQFRALTREPVAVGTFDDAPGDPIHHISLSKEADVFLIAPCTANVLGKIANGIADDLLTTTALATTAPIVLAPAMNVNMYENEATQKNMKTLVERGVRIVDADSGYLACGDVGKGRLAEPADIVDAVLDVLEVSRDMTGRRVIVTAGPTVEPIDAVRYISNPSSGKMGFALAEAAADRGADVVLVTGPVNLDDPDDVEVIRVKTAQEMFDAVDGVFADSDIAVFSAAVSDFRPEQVVDRKLKKGSDDDALTTIKLVENPDILATMGEKKRSGQYVIGFAAETENVVENARKKLENKHADMIVGNQVGESKGFGADENEAVLVTSDGETQLESMSKRALADRIFDEVLGK